MKRIVLFFAIIAPCLLQAKDIDVRKAGARPDGKTNCAAVIQKAIDLSAEEESNLILSELKSDLKDCIQDQNGNHVIQKIIERISQQGRKEILDVILGNVYQFSIHQYGCRVVQRIYEYAEPLDANKILHEIYQNYNNLCVDQYGNYVLQLIISKMKKGEAPDEFYDKLLGNVFQYSNQKYASNVLERCLGIGTPEQNKKLIDEVITSDNENKDTIKKMVEDRFGNYVIQKMIEVANKEDQMTLIRRIYSDQDLKKKEGFVKHVLNYIEKLVGGNTPGNEPKRNGGNGEEPKKRDFH